MAVDWDRAAGSSPHTRGAPRPLSPLPLGSRIIPAYAGSTFDSEFLWGPGTDHPRIRGEHVPVSVTPVSRCGSSPHTRGARLDGEDERVARGIIPAYAGSTGADQEKGDRAGDHPRIRGEHGHVEYAVGILLGSSPHTRGAPPA